MKKLRSRKKESLAAADVQPKSKQMTQLSIAGALASGIPNDEKQTVEWNYSSIFVLFG